MVDTYEEPSVESLPALSFDSIVSRATLSCVCTTTGLALCTVCGCGLELARGLIIIHWGGGDVAAGCWGSDDAVAVAVVVVAAAG